ncbi:MAG: glycosyltransferase [Desulfotomaculaceae bacterium]|nr:glycosyltransferase [Desulfotomaculaceae bacterium]
MKLWFLTTEYPPFYGGGIGTYMQHAAQMFAGAGHEVTVFIPDQVNSEERPAERVRLVRFRSGLDTPEAAPPGPEPDDHPAFPFSVMSYWPALSWQFAAIVREFTAREGPPDIIETQDYGGIGYYLLQQKLVGYPELAGLPVLVHLHAPTFELLPENQYPSSRLPEYWVGQMEKFCLVAADRLICPSQFLKRRVRQRIHDGQGKLNIDVLPLPYQARAVPGNNLPAPQKVLVCVGRLQLCKGTLPLLAGCERLWQAGEQFKLVLVGGDTELYAKGTTVGEYARRRYEQWIKAGRLEFTGNLPPEQCARQVAQAWAVLVPSLYDNFPLTCIEAMHAGKTVLASTAGGQGEMVVDGECGYVFDWTKPGSMEQCVKKALRLTPAENQALGARAKARISRLTAYENVLATRMSIYQEMRAQTGAGRIFPSVNQYEPPVLPPAPRVELVSAPGLLSVVIPYYNMGSYIDDALQSALNNTYRPIEILIINDGSNELSSLDKLLEIESAGIAEVRVVHIENRGLAAVRNFGAEQAKGEYLAFLDADDMVEKDFFSRCIDVLKRYDNVSLVYSWLRYFEAAQGCFIANNLEFPFLLAHNLAAVICVLKRADFLSYAVNKPRMSYGMEDYESWISLYESGRLGVCIPELLARYRVRADSMFRSMNDNQILFMHDEIVRLHPAAYQRYGDELFRLLNANGASFAWNSPVADWQSAERRLEWVEQALKVKDQAQDNEALQYLRERVAALEWAEQRLQDPANLGLKTSLKGLGFGLIRKTRQIISQKDS